MLRFLRAVSVTVLLGIIGCQDHEVIEVKDFKIFVDNEDQELKQSIKDLADQYNAHAGFQALTVVDSREDGNSVIRFTEGLQDQGHKLGLGQWITTSSEKTKFSLNGQTTKTTVVYAMEIEFDLENFKSKAPYIRLIESEERNHLYHLFCHEVGHGMQMDHGNDPSSVMYPTIPDRRVRFIDFEKYFASIKAFLKYTPEQAATHENVTDFEVQ